MSEVFNTLQAYLGSAYVNDFNKFGRTWQVKVQADNQFRIEPEDIRSREVRNDKGEMVCPLTDTSTEFPCREPQLLADGDGYADTPQVCDG